MKQLISILIFQVIQNGLFGQYFDVREKAALDTSLHCTFLRSDSVSHYVLPLAFGVDALFTNSNKESKAKATRIKVTPAVCLAGQLMKDDVVHGGGVGFSQLTLEGAYGKKWYVQGSGQYIGGQMPQYLHRGYDSLQVLPGWGKVLASNEKALQAFNWTGNLCYSPNRHFSLEVGHNKLMVGEGYRSLILSRNSAPYFFARSTVKAGDFRLYSIWTQLQDIGMGWGHIRKKYTAIHGLNWKITPKFQLGIHEMVIWQRNDSTSVRNFDMHYLNPLLFWRPVEYAQGSADNVLLAMSGSYIHRQKVKLYFQFLLDEWLLSAVQAHNGWWGLKYGGQMGVKWLDMLPGLNGLCEINAVRPFTYSHASPLQAWGNLNQPLAHPTGSNFVEWVSMFQYVKGDWKIQYQLNYNLFGRNTGDKNFGGNVFMSYMNPVSQYGNDLLQGDKHQLMYQQFSLSKVIGKWGEIFTQFTWRNDRTSLQTYSDQWIMLGIRTKGFQFQAWDY